MYQHCTSSTTTLLGSSDSQMDDPMFDEFHIDMEDLPNREASTTPISEMSSAQSPRFQRTIMNTFRETMNMAQGSAPWLPPKEQISSRTAAHISKSTPRDGMAYPIMKMVYSTTVSGRDNFDVEMKAALPRCAISLAATWNRDIVREIGEHTAEEVRAGSAQVFFGPDVSLHRGLLGEGNFKLFSEDPFLTGKLAASYVNGLQDQGIAAIMSGLVASWQEAEGFYSNTLWGTRPLRELYLRPLEIAIRDANPWAVMSSNNLVHVIEADRNEHLLQDILKREWRYDGKVISVPEGMNSSVGFSDHGHDTEVGAASVSYGKKPPEAVRIGELSQEEGRLAVASSLHLVDQPKLKHTSSQFSEQELNRPATHRLFRDAGAQGLVLLKNDMDMLPIKASQRRIAVIGPNANRATVNDGGGGSASTNPYYSTTLLSGIKAVPGREVQYALGYATYKSLPLATDYCTTQAKKRGVSLEFFHGDEFGGVPVAMQHRLDTDLYFWDMVPGEVRELWSCRATMIITPKSTGKHTIGFSSIGPGRLLVDGKLMIDLWNWRLKCEKPSECSQQVLVDMDLDAGKPITLIAEMTNEHWPINRQPGGFRTHGYGGVRINYQEEDKKDYLQEAVEAAESSDIAIVVIGPDEELVSGGYDGKQDLAGHSSQDHLVKAVLKANPRTIVVNQSGSPVTMPWAKRVPAILQGWYSGPEAGNALADVLFGFQNPSGKLPITFPQKLEDNPSYISAVGEDKPINCEEDLLIGYRYYEKRDIMPLFPFGHGLSYTTFTYGKPAISRTVLSDGDRITISIPVTNSGKLLGAETVQAYIHDDVSRLERPDKELQAFDKVFLRPRETKNAVLTLDKYSVGYYDPDLKAWIAEQGRFHVLIGSSSVDLRRQCVFEVKKSFTWVF